MCTTFAGYVSWRSHVWTDVDPDRTGVLPFVWDKDFGFERYVEYALDVPMYFLYQNGKYEDATQQRCTFREYMDGKMPDNPGMLLPALKAFPDTMRRKDSIYNVPTVHAHCICPLPLMPGHCCSSPSAGMPREDLCSIRCI